MAGDETAALVAAGAAVLRSLFELVGEPSYAQVIKRCELRGAPLSKATVSNLLAGKGAPLPRSVRAFVRACMELKPKSVPWPQGRSTVREWTDAYDTACGRMPTTGPASGVRTPPVRVGVLPVFAEALQPRAGLMRLLGDVIEEGKAAVLTQPVRVLSGLGGVGKSQLAASYVAEQWHDPTTDVIVWATATTPSGIVAAYAEAAVRLLGDTGGDTEQAARRFLSWAASTPKRWLIVLDDLQTPGDLAPWRPPVTATGQTVITTRYRGDAFERNDIELIPVDVFTAEESRAYLHQRLDHHPHLVSEPGFEAELDALAAELGQLPLVLAQASAYMINEFVSVSAYRGLVADQRRRLDELVPEKDELPDGHRTTIAATWVLSIQRANATAPEGVAWHLLQVASLLEPTGIPEAAFTAEAVTGYISETLDLDPPLDPHVVRRGLAVLHRYNLVTLDLAHPGHGVTVHNLVQRAARDAAAQPFDVAPPRAEPPLPPPLDPADLAYAVADALLDIWPVVDTASDIGAVLRANATALSRHAGAALWDPNMHTLLLHIGQSLGGSGQVHAATTHFHNLHAMAVARWGPEHMDVFAAGCNHAYWRGKGGDPRGAVAELEGLIEAMRRVQGPDALNVLNFRGHLAGLRAESGDRLGAMAELENLLEDHLRVLGPGHQSTAVVRSHLALLRADAGADVAVTELENLLDEELKRLPPEDPDILSTRNNLATLRGEAGDTARAVVEFEDLLKTMIRVLGPDHPNTLTTQMNLASMRGRAGDPVSAVAGLENVLARQLRVLGPDNPEILPTRVNLAEYRGAIGKPDENVVEWENALAEYRRVLGPDHPRTLDTRIRLVRLRYVAGHQYDVVTELTDLSATCLRVLGPDHPDTLTTRSDLVAARREAGEAVEVAELEKLLEPMNRVKGADHPSTMTVRSAHADRLGATGDVVGAVAEFKSLLADRLRVFGADHPQTLKTRAALARWSGELGEVGEAVVELERVLALMTREIGSADLNTTDVWAHLANFRGRLGDTAGAAREYRALHAELTHFLGPEHLETLNARIGLAYWLEKSGDVAGAATELKNTHELMLSVLGPDNPNTQAVYAWLAQMSDPAGGQPDLNSPPGTPT